ncbi:unnamed protein product [Chondrus crispus]|uniref:Uncharacterized protein n=1 Tax=Chondrus crispus TaxID=2769 RepID=R7QP09_CHOCR|nr:unnamed protein product [Chondrus crispus]CDF39834.1 unnamed protein product [Chondrus crispus]|eukprot:XP_005710128.1 unnamed protein product [Chondrus crispus]
MFSPRLGLLSVFPLIPLVSTVPFRSSFLLALASLPSSFLPILLPFSPLFPLLVYVSFSPLPTFSHLLFLLSLHSAYTCIPYVNSFRELKIIGKPFCNRTAQVDTPGCTSICAETEKVCPSRSWQAIASFGIVHERSIQLSAPCIVQQQLV